MDKKKFTEEEKEKIRENHVTTSYGLVKDLIRFIQVTYETGITSKLPKARQMSIEVLSEIFEGTLATATSDVGYIRELVNHIADYVNSDDFEEIVFKMVEEKENGKTKN